MGGKEGKVEAEMPPEGDKVCLKRVKVKKRVVRFWKLGPIV